MKYQSPKDGFNLSGKFHFGDDRTVEESGDRYYLEEDIKEFIRLLKEEIRTWDYKDRPDLIGLILFQDVDFVIDKLAGEKLI